MREREERDGPVQGMACGGRTKNGKSKWCVIGMETLYSCRTTLAEGKTQSPVKMACLK